MVSIANITLWTVSFFSVIACEISMALFDNTFIGVKTKTTVVRKVTTIVFFRTCLLWIIFLIQVDYMQFTCFKVIFLMVKGENSIKFTYNHKF